MPKDRLSTMKLLTTMVNSFKCKMTVLFILLFVGTQGNTETGCEATEGMILNCKFPKNMESTETDFLIYFYPDDGATDLLGNCSWNNNQLLCISQDGVQLQQPVSDKAVFSLPPRVVTKPGKYKCIHDGANSDNSKACHFHKSKKGAKTSTSSTVGAVILSAVVTLIIVTLFLILVWCSKNSGNRMLTAHSL